MFVPNKSFLTTATGLDIGHSYSPVDRTHSSLGLQPLPVYNSISSFHVIAKRDFSFAGVVA